MRHSRPWLIAFACAVAGAQAPVFRPGPDVVAPFVVSKPTPAYSGEGRLAKLEGSVLLALIVGADGKPRDIQVVRSLGLGLDESALGNVRTWEIQPGMKNGMPVDVLVNEEVFFRPARTLWDWHTIRAVFQSPRGAMRPVLINAKFPATVDEEENASVTVGFEIGAKGTPVNLRVVKSSDPRWEAGILRAVRGWRFRPAYINQQAATVPAYFEFVRGSHSPIPPVKLPPD